MGGDREQTNSNNVIFWSPMRKIVIFLVTNSQNFKLTSLRRKLLRNFLLYIGIIITVTFTCYGNSSSFNLGIFLAHLALSSKAL
jgi:hypothetical protein